MPSLVLSEKTTKNKKKCCLLQLWLALEGLVDTVYIIADEENLYFSLRMVVKLLALHLCHLLLDYKSHRYHQGRACLLLMEYQSHLLYHRSLLYSRNLLYHRSFLVLSSQRWFIHQSSTSLPRPPQVLVSSWCPILWLSVQKWCRLFKEFSSCLIILDKNILFTVIDIFY